MAARRATDRGVRASSAARLIVLCLAALTLQACFAHTSGSAINVAARMDVAGLAGVYLDPAADDAARMEVRREGVGLYRFIGPPAAPSADLVQSMTALAGDCSVLETPEERAECSEPDAGFCDGAIETRAECQAFVAAIRGAPTASPLSARDRGAVTAVRWIADGLPYRDEILFAVRPLLAPELQPGWGVAQAERILSIGPFTDFAILEPQVLPLDLLLVRAEPERLLVYATDHCVDAGGGAPTALSGDALIAAMAACAVALAAEEDQAGDGVHGERRWRLTRLD